MLRLVPQTDQEVQQDKDASKLPDFVTQPSQEDMRKVVGMKYAVGVDTKAAGKRSLAVIQKSILDSNKLRKVAAFAQHAEEEEEEGEGDDHAVDVAAAVTAAVAAAAAAAAAVTAAAAGVEGKQAAEQEEEEEEDDAFF
jgi:hypothetical protein